MASSFFLVEPPVFLPLALFKMSWASPARVSEANGRETGYQTRPDFRGSCRERGDSPLPRTTRSSLRFFVALARIVCSTVLAEARRKTRTGFVWPMRCARSIACKSLEDNENLISPCFSLTRKTLGLVLLWVPVRVKDDDGVSADQVQADTSGSSRKQKDVGGCGQAR